MVVEGTGREVGRSGGVPGTRRQGDGPTVGVEKDANGGMKESPQRAGRVGFVERWPQRTNEENSRPS